MKQIIIFLLIVILAIMGFNQYKKYKRFSLSGYGYTIPEGVDVNYWDEDFLWRYHQAVERMNGYVITQWSAHGIDVRNPKKDNDKTKAAVQGYSDLMAKVKFYEQTLIASTESKKAGMSNAEIRAKKMGLDTTKPKVESDKNTMIREMFEDVTSKQLRVGNTGALVYEVQRILIDKGYNIPLDGIYRSETAGAVNDFEEKNNLFPDGVVDRLTLEALLR